MHFTVEMRNANATGSTQAPQPNDNQLSEVSCPEYCLCNAAEEKSINCNGELIFPFPRKFPPDVLRLTMYNFRKTDLHPLDMMSLHNSTELRELRLQRNGVNILHNRSFITLKKLKRLDVSENKLSQITNLTFIGLSSLLYLDLSSNRIAIIDPGSFAYLRDLIRLELSSNKLTSLPSELFQGLTSLQYLSLEVNHIVNMQENTFLQLNQLVHLNLAMNPIEELENVSLQLPHLQYADFSHCRLTKVPQNLPATIRDIRLSGNKLGTVYRRDLEIYQNLAILVLGDVT